MKKKAWLTTGVVCGSLITLLAVIKYFEFSAAMAQVNAMPEYSETVKSVTAHSQQYAKSAQFHGNIVVPQHVVLQNETAGVIAQVNRLSGARVDQGEIIIQLDINAEKAQLASAQARKKLAHSIYQRAIKLRESDAISQEQLDKAYADWVVIKSDIEVLNDTIRKKTIKAPFDGVIGIHSAQVGAFLGSNSPVLTISGDSDYVWVDFYVPQFYPQLAIGSVAKVRRIGNDKTEYVAEAIISAVDDAVTTGVRSRKYRARLYHSSVNLDANTAVSVEVPVEANHTVLVVPNDAVLSDLVGNYVYTLVAEEAGQGLRAKRVNVEVVDADAQYSMVDAALSEQDQIAATGAFKLFDGVLVNLAKENAVAVSGLNDSNEG